MARGQRTYHQSGSRGGGSGRGNQGRQGHRSERPSPKDFQRPLPSKAFDTVPFRPGDVKEAQVLNLGLWLDKMVPLRRNENPNAKKTDDDWTLKEGHRLYALEQMFDNSRRGWHSKIGEQALERQRIASEASRMKIRTTARVEGRLLVDAGRSSTIETTLSFHHIWGVPRIPGSAIKGMVRAFMEDDDVPQRTLDRLFGPDLGDRTAIASKGKIYFYDALPESGRFRLSVDVLTPHYRQYYDGGAPPGDWQSPIPHTFLTVVDTRFVFYAVATSDTITAELDAVRESMKDALEYFGVGGKRAAGYGRLVVEKDE